MRPFLVFLLVLSLAAPAGADEVLDVEDVTSLTDLTAEAEVEIAFFRSVVETAFGQLPLPEDDFAGRTETRVLRADAFIGLLLSRAHETLYATLPDEAVHAVLELGGSVDEPDVLAVIDEAGPASVWAAEGIATDWVEFQTAVNRLRRVAEPGSPERACPVDGVADFRNEWEFPRPWGRIHKGVDMLAEAGTHLVAVEDGVVIQADWHYLGGRQIYFKADATGDIFYYAHLETWPDWLWTGTRLEAGDYLGKVGSSGNAATPHLHLGWMPGSEAVDLATMENAYYLMFELCR